jgi:hypothetical protein
MFPPTQSVASGSFLAPLSSGQKEGTTSIEGRILTQFISMEQRPSLGSNDHLIIQEVASPLWKLKVHYRVQRESPWSYPKTD